MITNILNWYQKNKEFRKTYNQLSSLSDRELDDLGIHRGNITDVAKIATFGKGGL